MAKLPFRVTLLVWLVLLLTVWNALQWWTALAWQSVLKEYTAEPASWVAALSAGIWMFTGLAIIWGIWQNKAWAARTILWAAVGYTAWYWSERLIFHQPHPNWPFVVILNLILLIFVFIASRSLRREAYDRKSNSPKDE